MLTSKKESQQAVHLISVNLKIGQSEFTLIIGFGILSGYEVDYWDFFFIGKRTGWKLKY